MRRIQKYGWRRDLPDHRDRHYSAPRATPLAKLVDLSRKRPQALDQGQLGSCTANAISFNMDFCLIKQARPAIVPSRLFVYYNERAIEGAIASDDGAQIRNGIKTVARHGAPPENVWPYLEEKFAITPTGQAYREALKHRVDSYARVPQDPHAMKYCLASGFPFVFGFTVYDEFESDQVAVSGNLGLPKRGERPRGGHAVCCVGYNDAKDVVLPDGKTWPQETFLVQNSWGAGWGIRGMFTIPQAYLLNPDLADDFWTIRLVEG